MDGELVINEMWLSREEIREGSLSPDERARMMQAKRKELTNYFDNGVWEFTDVAPAREACRQGKVADVLVLHGFQDPESRCGRLGHRQLNGFSLAGLQ